MAQHVDVRWVIAWSLDTNLEPARCGFNPDTCGAAALAVLTWTLPSLALK